MALTLIFVKGYDTAFVAYPFYVLSFYTLTVLVLWLTVHFGQFRSAVRQKLHACSFVHRFMTDAAFHMLVSLYVSLGINLLFAAFNLVFAILNRSVWYITLSVYYILLSLLRFLMLRFSQKNTLGEGSFMELRRARLCSLILLTLTLSLSGVVILVIRQGESFVYQGIFIYVAALYAFYSVTHASVNMVKYRKYQSPVMSVAKAISFAASLVSMLSLETAMLYEFGQDMREETKHLFIAATGAGIALAVLAVSGYMIVKTTKALRRHRKESPRL